MDKNFIYQNGVNGRSSLSVRLVAARRSFVDYQAEAGRCATTDEKDSQQKKIDFITTFVSNITHDNGNVTNTNSYSNASVNKSNNKNTNTNKRKNWSRLDNIKVIECYFWARKGLSKGYIKRMGQC